MVTRGTILLVEDDPTEEMLARRAISRADVGCDVRVARDGAEACSELFGLAGPPAIVILDLNLPKLNGFEVLARIRSTETTKRLPVIVFSNSTQQHEVDRSFDLHANSFVVKDMDLDRYESRLKLLIYYWIAVNQSPC